MFHAKRKPILHPACAGVSVLSTYRWDSEWHASGIRKLALLLVNALKRTQQAAATQEVLSRHLIQLVVDMIKCPTFQGHLNSVQTCICFGESVNAVFVTDCKLQS